MPGRPDVPCARCGKLLWRGKSSLPPGMATCRECRRVLSSAVKGQRAGFPAAVCLICGDAFWPKVSGSTEGPSVTCSRRCGALARYGHVVDADPVLAGASREARSAAVCARRHHGSAVLVVDAVEPLVVFERDGWRCHLCWRLIDRGLSGRHRMGPTLDHLVPVSAYGEHSYANVRSAHRACNSRRGDGKVSDRERRGV